MCQNYDFTGHAKSEYANASHAQRVKNLAWLPQPAMPRAARMGARANQKFANKQASELYRLIQ